MLVSTSPYEDDPYTVDKDKALPRYLKYSRASTCCQTDEVFGSHDRDAPLEVKGDDDLMGHLIDIARELKERKDITYAHPRTAVSYEKDKMKSSWRMSFDFEDGQAYADGEKEALRKIALRLGHTGDISNAIERQVLQHKHRFQKVDVVTGHVEGAEAGNVHFHVGGVDNRLTETGKVILDNLVTGKYKREVIPFKNQSFIKLRSRALNSSALFEDPEFPPNYTMISRDLTAMRYRVEWKRPHEIVTDPQFLNADYSRFDVNQGSIGDCWFVAALSAFTFRKDLFHLVIPPDQSFTENYAGIFHFQFWHYGQWVDVVIDDLLPTITFSGVRELAYAKSRERNEFWPALVEKAYAKLYGSYDRLVGGQMTEAFEDLTGGISEVHHVLDRDTIFDVFVRGFHSRALFCAGINPEPGRPAGERPDGLYSGHAYSITALEVVKVDDVPKVLLRIRNPYGNSKEWRGDFSDNSPMWKRVDRANMERIKHEFRDDGEFWMSLADFMLIFNILHVTNLPKAVLEDIARMTETPQDDQIGFVEHAETGKWSIEEGSAGGSRHPGAFACNPQYRTTISAPLTVSGGECILIVSLLQKHRREQMVNDVKFNPIGVFLFKAPNGERTRLSKKMLEGDETTPVASVPKFELHRQVSIRATLNEGNYIVVPSTLDGRIEGEYLLRFFVNGHVTTKLLDSVRVEEYDPNMASDEKKNKFCGCCNLL